MVSSALLPSTSSSRMRSTLLDIIFLPRLVLDKSHITQGTSVVYWRVTFAICTATESLQHRIKSGLVSRLARNRAIMRGAVEDHSTTIRQPKLTLSPPRIGCALVARSVQGVQTCQVSRPCPSRH